MTTTTTTTTTTGIKTFDLDKEFEGNQTLVEIDALQDSELKDSIYEAWFSSELEALSHMYKASKGLCL